MQHLIHTDDFTNEEIQNILNDAKIVYEVYSLSLTCYKGDLGLVEPERQLFQIKIKK